MTDPLQHDFSGDALPTADRIDSRCDAFEQEWLAGREPRLEDYLGDTAGPARTTLFVELVELELEYRRRRGETPTIAEYLQRFPEFSDVLSKRLSELRADDTQAADDSIPATQAYQQFPPHVRHFQMLERLGSGAFGDVYRARDLRLDRDVAIKVPRLAEFAPERLERVLQEARMAARLGTHPGIVTIYEANCENDAAYIVMEIIEGPSLRHQLERGPLPLERAVTLVEQMAETLHYAHKRGLIHRDLKPANILLDVEGRPRIADFGLALHEDQQHRYANQVAGTANYMSPEQVRGEAHRIDGRTDVWSLGVVFYELLTGRRPFQGNRDQVFDEVLHRHPKPPRQINDTIPEELERICLKCLAKDPTQRYTTAGDLAADLRRSRKQSLHRVPRWSIATMILVLIGLIGGIGAAAMHLATSRTSDEAPAPPDDLEILTAGQRSEPAPVALFDPTLRDWQRLLTREPESLFPDDGPRADFSDKLRELFVDSAFKHFRELGDTQHVKDFKIQVDLVKSVHAGVAGLFFGYKPGDPLNGKPTWTMQTLTLDGTRAEALQITRNQLRFSDFSEGKPSLQDSRFLGMAAVEPPRPRGTTLELTVHSGLVTQVRWGDQELDLSDRPQPRGATTSAVGRFGLVNGPGATTFRNAQYMALGIEPAATRKASDSLATLGPDDWLQFDSLSVSNYYNGNRLLTADDRPLKAKTIQVYATDVDWKPDEPESSRIVSPAGNSQPSDGSFRFPYRTQFGIYLWQFSRGFQAITSDSPETAQTLSIDPSLEIYVQVNDRREEYENNSGHFGLRVRVLEP